MDEEMVALDANRTWELVPLLEGKKAIGRKVGVQNEAQLRWKHKQV
jgi:hypothetical protein